MLWAGVKPRAEGGVERREPDLPSLQKLPLGPHLAFLGPPACHTAPSTTPALLALPGVFCNGGKPEMGLTQALGLGHLQTRREPERGSVLRGLLAGMIISPPRRCRWGQLLLVLGSAPSPLASARCQLSVANPADRPGEFGAGMVSPCSALPARPSAEAGERRGKRTAPPEKYMQRVPRLPPRPCHPGLLRRLPSAASSRRVLWIYFCIYKYNVRMARSIANNIRDTAVNGARCKVWLPGTLAHAGR